MYVIIYKKNRPTERNPYLYYLCYAEVRAYRWAESKGLREICFRRATDWEQQEAESCNRMLYWKYMTREDLIESEKKLHPDLKNWHQELIESL